MVDTFNPLHLAVDALELDKRDYQKAWLVGDEA
jgi:hypothetical protein